MYDVCSTRWRAGSRDQNASSNDQLLSASTAPEWAARAAKATIRMRFMVILLSGLRLPLADAVAATSVFASVCRVLTGGLGPRMSPGGRGCGRGGRAPLLDEEGGPTPARAGGGRGGAARSGTRRAVLVVLRLDQLPG